MEVNLDFETVRELERELQDLAFTFEDCVAFFESKERAEPTSSGDTGDDPGHIQDLEPFPGASECIIASAAFGSELAPQVQLLRGFRDSHILSTASGSSFMNVFNIWYYSFSPHVAEYERGQPWMQQTVRTAIYPLLGILQISEKAYSSMPGEYGAVSAGLVASAMIGGTYFSPLALAIRQVRRSKINYKMMSSIAAAVCGALVVSILLDSRTALMATTPLFVLTIMGISALLSAGPLSRFGKIYGVHSRNRNTISVQHYSNHISESAHNRLPTIIAYCVRSRN